MKRRVLSKTTPFHAKKREREQNVVVLNDTVPLSSSPGHAVGEERNFCFSSLILHASLSLSLSACFCQKPEAQCPFIDETPRVAPCQPHRVATSFGVAAGQEVAAPHAQL